MVFELFFERPVKSTIMRYVIITLLIGILLSCESSDVKRLKQKYKTLSEEKLRQDSLLNEFMLAFEHIEENLRIIKERENIIALKADDPDFYLTGEERILRDIKMISDLLLENKEIIEDLDSRWSQVNQQNAILQDVVSKLTSQLEENDKRISDLTSSLSVKDEELATLTKRNDELMKAQANLMDEIATNKLHIAEKDNLLNKNEEEISFLKTQVSSAYFITGDRKRLKAKNIIAGNQKLGYNFDLSQFVKINVDEVNFIPVAKKKAKLLTRHPKESYVFHEKNNRIENIEIVDAKKFWEVSKYLVVLTN